MTLMFLLPETSVDDESVVADAVAILARSVTTIRWVEKIWIFVSFKKYKTTLRVFLWLIGLKGAT